MKAKMSEGEKVELKAKVKVLPLYGVRSAGSVIMY